MGCASGLQGSGGGEEEAAGQGGTDGPRPKGTVVGSSSGGVLALQLAVARPDLVSAFVLLDPVYEAALVPSPPAAAAIGRAILRWALRRNPQGAVRRYYRWATGYADGGNQFDAYPEEWQWAALTIVDAVGRKP
ncbi:alpha/beta fold hydrolase [Streptomyces caniscabiei]|uniref:alpha/beta fold hydrolase n=1 Tax=Streptomyces caniscabiei TaxID=2746961 RepID=UPI0015C505D7|nr:alpha/beta fold hydrolase [Streptomyces caniscabiei]MDX3727989.1 alpha/beta fold hydrolase [Streptomyces caniscabiei]